MILPKLGPDTTWLGCINSFDHSVPTYLENISKLRPYSDYDIDDGDAKMEDNLENFNMKDYLNEM